MKMKQFVKLLKKNGGEVIKGRGKGGHILVKLHGRMTTVPIHSADYDPDFLDDICKQLGTRLKELLP